MDIFAQYTALAALAVVAVQQILKLNVIPLYFANRYPVLTNIALSIIATIIVSWKTVVTLNGWVSWLVEIATISLVAAITYNMTIKNSEAVQEASNKKA